MLTLFCDMMPEERGLAAMILAFAFHETIAIALQSVVHGNGFVLLCCQMRCLRWICLSHLPSLPDSSSHDADWRSRDEEPA